MTQTVSPQWIAVDWGTSNLRAFAMRNGTVLAEAASDDGMGALPRDGFEPALLRLIEPWLSSDRQVPVIACGMVGSRQGWHEAPYRSVPCIPLNFRDLVTVPTIDPRLSVRIVPGLRQNKPADVMRGEETQLAGALVLDPGFDGVFCLPGTHSKWVHVSAGEVVSFQTYMTGEMFALLSGQSVLRHGMAGGGWDEAAFLAGMTDVMARPEKLAAMLFSLRAEGLLTGLGASVARSRLSGLLIGAELAAARPYWLGQAIVIIGADVLSANYGAALRALGCSPRQMPAAATVLAGLGAAFEALKEPTT